MTARSLPRLALSKEDRLLVVAPHPDDELIAAGLIIQKALAAGARVHVVLLTLGDAFGYAGPTPVGKRVATRRTESLGATRRRESLRALGHIGVDPAHVTFLGYPDRGLAALWEQHWSREKPYRSPFTLQEASPYDGILTLRAPHAGEALADDLIALLRRLRPTLCVYPHPQDATGITRWPPPLSPTPWRRWPAKPPGCRAAGAFTTWCTRGAGPVPGVPTPGRPWSLPALAGLGQRWVEVVGTTSEIRRKYQAILMYRSQIPPLGRFLTSFVRRSEVFAVGKDGEVPPCSREQPEPLIGGEAAPWPQKPQILDAVGDSVTKQVERAGDIAAVYAQAGRAHLFLRLEMAGRVAGDVEYRVILSDCPRTRRLVLRLKPPHRVMEVTGARPELLREVVARAAGRRLELAIPAELLGFPRKVFVAVETRSRGIGIDRSGYHLLHLPGWQEQEGAPSVVCAAATAADLAPCAAIFAESFRESLLHLFKEPPPLRLIQEMFRLCFEAEPGALMVAVAEGKVVGYVCAPVSLRRLWRAAVSRRYALRWLAGWLRGRLRLGWTPLRLLFLDKLQFVRSAVAGELAADARILSVAVAPGYRGRGIATQLIRHALARFAAHGVGKVRLEVRPWNEAAIRVYQSLGFEAMGTMHDSGGAWSVMLLDLQEERV